MSKVNLQNSLSPTSSIGDKDEVQNDIKCFDWRNEKPRSGNITLEVPVSRNTFHYFKSWTLEHVKAAWPFSETEYTEQDQSNLLNDITGFYKQKSREVGDVVFVTETYRSKEFPGRLYSNGCQGLVRAVRSNMLSETADVDMVNGQPTTVVYVCRNLDAIKTPTFDDYVENRDPDIDGVGEGRIQQIMEEANVSKGKAKQLVIMTLTSGKLLTTGSAYLNKLDREAKQIQVALMARPELQWILPYCKNPENRAGSFMALLYHFVENKLLMCGLDMLRGDDIGVSALVFDGMNLTDGRHHGDEKLLDRLHNACERIAPGINMIWAWKPLDFVLESKNKKPLTNSDGSPKKLEVPSSYTPPLKYRKGNFAKHRSEFHEDPSGSDESPSLNASCVLSKSSCDLSPFHQIGFLNNSFKDTPSFNMDTFRQSLVLDVNPVSFQPQFYEIVDDPSNPGFDGSSHVFDKRILSLTNSLNETIGAGSECAHYLSTLTAAIGRCDGCVRKLLHLPLMQRQQLNDDRFDMGSAEGNNPDLPYVTENRCLVVPHHDGQSTYQPNTNLAAVLLNSELRVSCVAAETEGDSNSQEVSLTVGYDTSHRSILCLEVCNADGSVVFNSGDLSAPQDFVRGILCLWEWSEQELKVGKRKAPSYSPPWRAALLAISNRPSIAAQLSTSLLLNQLGPTLRYEPKSKSFWLWTPRDLWEEDIEPNAAVKASATQLCEHAMHLLHRPAVFARATEDALKRFPSLMAEAKSAKRKRNYDDGDGDGCNVSAGDEGAFCDDELQMSIASRTLSTSLSTQPRNLDRVLATMKDFVFEPGFEEAFQKTRALAFVNGVQDMFAPYSFHQPTPADRVSGRLPYAIDPAPTSNAEMEELKEWAIARYRHFGFGRETALREADKDAVTLTGSPAVLSQANIRAHLGPYDATRKEYGSRCGKNLRLTMLQKVFGNFLNAKMAAGFLSMKMDPGKAYSMFNGIEHHLMLWIDEAQNKKRNEESKVESWNEGIVLRIATGSTAPQFQYRLENGREKTVTLKTQSINVSSNKIKIPDNAGIRSKFEVSPYPNLGFHTDAEVEASNAAGQPAFKIDLKLLDAVEQEPGKLMRYYVERAKAILSNPEEAYPRSQAIIDATARVLEQSTVGAAELDATNALERLQIICEMNLKECFSAEGTLESTNGDAPDYNKFQLKSPRCFCVGCPTGKACHFKVEAFSGLLKTVDIELYNFYIRKANQTGRLTSALQKVLNLNERPLVKVNKYGHGCIFGWTIASPRHKSDAMQCDSEDDYANEFRA